MGSEEGWLHVLFVGDSADCAEAVKNRLAEDFAGCFSLTAAESGQAFLHHIAEGQYDVIVCGGAPPGFTVLEALEHREHVCPDVPLICVSEEIGGERAVELLRRGACDYVRRDGLQRLNAAVRRALQEAGERRRMAEGGGRIPCFHSALTELVEGNRLILDAMGEGIALLDGEGAILNLNAAFARQLGCRPEEAVGRAAPDWAGESPRDGARLDCGRQIRRAAETCGQTSFEMRAGDRTCQVTLFPVLEEGRTSALLAISADITDRLLAREELRKRQEAEARLTVMTEFFTNVSHELRTPLTLILMQLEMMRSNMDDRKKMASLLDDATLNSYRLTRLANNLLDVAKMDSGFLTATLHRRDAVAMLRNISESVTGYAAAKGIALTFHSGLKSLQMDLDGDKFERILLNLLSNAIRHTPAGGSISISLERQEDMARISVQDTGEGIPQDRLATVFDRFVQVNNPRSRVTEGCGIGLALVKSMVELHNGRVWVESEQGRGSTFFVELPVENRAGRSRYPAADGFELNKKVKMELSDLYIKA